MSANALLARFGLMGFSALMLERGVSAEQGALIATRVGLSEQTIDAMTFAALAPHAHFLFAPSARYLCRRGAETHPTMHRRSGVARRAENSVEHAAAVPAATDAEGEANLRGILKSWPSATRRRPVAAHEGLHADRQKRAEAGSIAAQSHKLCSSPTNFGSLRPMNYKSKSRNYARPCLAERGLPQITTSDAVYRTGASQSNQPPQNPTPEFDFCGLSTQ
jgi:hypothetical protein